MGGYQVRPRSIATLEMHPEEKQIDRLFSTAQTACGLPLRGRELPRERLVLLRQLEQRRRLSVQREASLPASLSSSRFFAENQQRMPSLSSAQDLRDGGE